MNNRERAFERVPLTVGDKLVLAFMAIMCALCFVGMCSGCAAAAEPVCELEGDYLMTLEPQTDSCPAWELVQPVSAGADDTCSFAPALRNVAGGGTVTCDEGAPTAFCQGGWSYMDRGTQCVFALTLERVE